MQSTAQIASARAQAWACRTSACLTCRSPERLHTPQQSPLNNLSQAGKIFKDHHARWRPQLRHSHAARAEGSGENEPAASPQDDDGFGPNGIEDPVVHDLFYGMGSSGKSGDRPVDAPDPLSPEEAAALMGMGSWRLGRHVCPAIETLVAQIEGGWRVSYPDLGLCEIPQRYRYMDSMDPGGSNPLSHQLPDPEREDPGWPRLQVENRAYQTYAFRKLHLEVATRQDGLQVLHCVMYPRPNFDLPILSLDLVAMEGRVTLAIIDPCPVTQDLSLPAYYTSTAAGFQERYGVATNRSIPEWVTAIFSQLCVLMRPQTPEEVGAFLKYAIALCAFHAQMGRLAAPVRATRSVSDAQAMRQRAEIQAAHERYCAKQLENDKTRRVLEGAFGSGPAEEYMRVVMFDAAEAAAKEAAAAAAPGNGAAGTNGSVPKTAPSP